MSSNLSFRNKLILFRNSIEITPTDIPILPLTTQEPPVPVYCDANVTVYGIPIVPTEESPESSKPLSKRKRDSSPDSPNKRLNLADPSSDTEAKSLERLIESADFRPEQLDGSLADEYRQLILKTMFPLVSKAEKGKKKGKKDGNAPAPPKPGPCYCFSAIYPSNYQQTSHLKTSPQMLHPTHHIAQKWLPGLTRNFQSIHHPYNFPQSRQWHTLLLAHNIVARSTPRKPKLSA